MIEVVKYLHEVIGFGITKPGEYEVCSGYDCKLATEDTWNRTLFDTYKLIVLDTNYLDHGNGD